MRDVETLKPFTRFLMTIGTLPSSYLVSMTYEEQLLWFCNFLQKEVIPTVNNNAEAVIELQNYVSSYFDNLDVQEEINNKLDEMAESGELTDIIAQYLQLAGVLAYDTKNDMKQAQNLSNGSIAKTLGDLTYKDGEGSYYKIRQVQNTDTIDNENIIALDDENLVAEKINNGIFKQKYYLGSFHKKYSEHDKRDYLFISNDAINWTKIPDIEIQGESSSGGSDPSIYYDESTQYFMIAYSNQDTTPEPQCFTIMRSKDLKNWTEHPISLTLPDSIQGYNKWAPDFFKDSDGKLYIVFSADKTPNQMDFECLITELTDVENLTFTNPTIITREDPSNEYDYSIRKIGDTYYMVASNVGIVKLYTSSTLNNFEIVNDNLFQVEKSINTIQSVEGCNLEVINNKLYVYVEYYNLFRIVMSEIDTTNYTLIKPTVLNSLQNYKHGSIMNLTDNHAINVVNKNIKNLVGENELIPMNYDRFTLILDSDTTLPIFTLLPNQILVIRGNGHKLTINKIVDPYKLYKLKYTITDGNGIIEIGGYEDDQYSSYKYTATTGSIGKVINVDFCYNALDDSYNGGISGTISVSKTNMSGTIVYKQIGRNVNLIVNLALTAPITLSEACDIPTELKPSNNIVTKLINRSTSGQDFSIVTNTSKLFINSDHSGDLQGCVTYMI